MEEELVGPTVTAVAVWSLGAASGQPRSQLYLQLGEVDIEVAETGVGYAEGLLLGQKLVLEVTAASIRLSVEELW